MSCFDLLRGRHVFAYAFFSPVDGALAQQSNADGGGKSSTWSMKNASGGMHSALKHTCTYFLTYG
jgi:hypothetical protein